MKNFAVPIRYGVVANIAVSHTAAGGSIPPIGVFFFVLFIFFLIFLMVYTLSNYSIPSRSVVDAAVCSHFIKSGVKEDITESLP